MPEVVSSLIQEMTTAQRLLNLSSESYFMEIRA